MDQIILWRIILIGGILSFLGGMGIFTLKLLAASTGRKRILEFFIK